LSGADEASREASAEALSLAASVGQPDLLLDVIHSALYATVTPEVIQDQLLLGRRGLEIAVHEGDDFAELRLIIKVMLRLFVAMDSAALARQHDRQSVLVRRFRQPYYLLVHAGYEVAMALCEGRLAAAEAAAEDYRRWGELNHQDDGAYGIQMFSIRREQGRLAEFRPVLELAARLAGSDSGWAPGLAALYAGAGMTTEASALLDRLAAEELASLPDDSLVPGVMSYLADAAFECEHRAIAPQVLARLAPFRGLSIYVPGLVCYGAADRYLGRLYSTLGQHDAALAAFEAALALDERAGWSTWIAHSQFALAHHLATMARPAHLERATELAGDAAATAASLGMSGLLGRADALLEGLRPAPADAGGSLTPRESEVLHLLCQGKSNRQIGEELRASHHTIANHVRAILAKTGAANRTEAATWAHHHGAM
jgi:DNA-binding CsgD family transcriptional regulator